MEEIDVMRVVCVGGVVLDYSEKRVQRVTD